VLTLPARARSGSNWFRVNRTESSRFSMSSFALLYSYRLSRAVRMVSSRLTGFGSKVRLYVG
jgi:hypothetical protein